MDDRRSSWPRRSSRPGAPGPKSLGGPTGRVQFAGDELELDQQPTEPQAKSWQELARFEAESVCHEETGLGRHEELARQLAGPFGKLSEQVLVGKPRKSGCASATEAVAQIGERLITFRSLTG